MALALLKFALETLGQLQQGALGPGYSQHGRHLLSGGGAPAGADYCQNYNVTYEHRVDNTEGWNWCLVPDGGFDAIFFAGLAIITMCLASARWDALIVLFFGGVYFAFAYYFNLEHVSNAVMLWLGMRPADIFVFVFLPPFLLDLSVRVDYFLLKKVAFNVAFMAFVMVIMSCLMLIPFMLYALDLQASGWTAAHVALFGSMIASTDAASVSAVLRSGGGPEILSVLLEGECLFNDASSLTLFEIFKEVVVEHERTTLAHDLEGIVVRTIWSCFVGVCIGVALGIFTRWVYAWMQHRNMEPQAEVAWSVGGAYLSFYITQVWCRGSGCVGSVAFGLYGSGTLLWGMSTKARLTGIFDKFWTVMTFLINGLIFFYVGASAVNFTIRASNELFEEEGSDTLAIILLYKLPLIYLASFTLRFVLMYLSFKFLQLVRLSEPRPIQEVAFLTIGGLRGSLSLVLAQSAATLASTSVEDRRVKAEIAIFTAGYVVMTLLINAPLAAPALTLLGLDKVRQEQLAMRGEVKNLFRKFTSTAIEDLEVNQDEDELLQGLDWAMLKKETNFDHHLDKELPEIQPRVRWFVGTAGRLWTMFFVPGTFWMALRRRCCGGGGGGGGPRTSDSGATDDEGFDADAAKAEAAKAEADLKRATQYNMRELGRAESRAPGSVFTSGATTTSASSLGSSYSSGGGGGLQPFGKTFLVIRDQPRARSSTGPPGFNRTGSSNSAAAAAAQRRVQSGPPLQLPAASSLRRQTSRLQANLILNTNGSMGLAPDGTPKTGGVAAAAAGAAFGAAAAAAVGDGNSSERQLLRSTSRFMEGAVAGPMTRQKSGALGSPHTSNTGMDGAAATVSPKGPAAAAAAASTPSPVTPALPPPPPTLQPVLSESDIQLVEAQPVAAAAPAPAPAPSPFATPAGPPTTPGGMDSPHLVPSHKSTGGDAAIEAALAAAHADGDEPTAEPAERKSASAVGPPRKAPSGSTGALAAAAAGSTPAGSRPVSRLATSTSVGGGLAALVAGGGGGGGAPPVGLPSGGLPSGTLSRLGVSSTTAPSAAHGMHHSVSTGSLLLPTPAGLDAATAMIAGKPDGAAAAAVDDGELLQSVLVIKPSTGGGGGAAAGGAGATGTGKRAGLAAASGVRLVQRLGEDGGGAIEALRVDPGAAAGGGARPLGRGSVRLAAMDVTQDPAAAAAANVLASPGKPLGRASLTLPSAPQPQLLQAEGSRPLGRGSGIFTIPANPLGAKSGAQPFEPPSLGPFEFALPEELAAQTSGAVADGPASKRLMQLREGEPAAAADDGGGGGGAGGGLGRSSVRPGGAGASALGRASVRLGRPGLTAASVHLARIYDAEPGGGGGAGGGLSRPSVRLPTGGEGAGGALGRSSMRMPGADGGGGGGGGGLGRSSMRHPAGGGGGPADGTPGLGRGSVRLSDVAALQAVGERPSVTSQPASASASASAGGNHILAQVALINQRDSGVNGGGSGGGSATAGHGGVAGGVGGSGHGQHGFKAIASSVLHGSYLQSLVRRSAGGLAAASRGGAAGAGTAGGGGGGQYSREGSGRGTEGAALGRRTRMAETAAALARASASGALRDVEGGGAAALPDTLDSPLLVEYRMRLLAGLKQYYRQKHAEGSLSPSAYKVLSYVADQSYHHPELPLALWSMVRQEVGAGLLLQAEASVYFKLKHWTASAKTSSNGFVRTVVPRLLVPFVWVLSGHISATTLRGLETAVELWASLTQSLQTEWLQYSGLYGELLLEEVQHEADGAWAYIIERRIEAPNKFGAVQTHRAIIELLTQQQTFVRDMNAGGMIDESECRKIVEVVERRLQLLARRGPRWRQPTVTEVLANTAFLRGVPQRVIEWIRKNSDMRVYQQGAAIWDMGRKMTGAAPDGLIVVIRGVVRMMADHDGVLVPYYLGAGGVGGLTSCVLESHVPGMSSAAAYAEGNAMGKGPVVMHIPWSLLQVLRRFSREEGLAPYQALELQLYRTAAAYVLDILKQQVSHQFSAFIRSSMLTILLSKRTDAPAVRRQRVRLLLQPAANSEHVHIDGGIDWLSELMAQPEPVVRQLLSPDSPPTTQAAAVAAVAAGASGAEAMASATWLEAMYKAVAASTMAVVDVIRSSIKDSMLLVLSPGQGIVQRTTMVLIQGSLQPTPVLLKADGSGGASGAGGPFVASTNEKHVAPSVMVWVSDFFEGDLVAQKPLEVVAGARGATLLVWGVDPEDLLLPPPPPAVVAAVMGGSGSGKRRDGAGAGAAGADGGAGAAAGGGGAVGSSKSGKVLAKENSGPLSGAAAVAAALGLGGGGAPAPAPKPLEVVRESVAELSTIGTPPGDAVAAALHGAAAGGKAANGSSAVAKAPE
ncbi:hypothetical protein HYH02_006526 [Chlamydomonas schloesseri]|uniref:Cation/H+ exchanger domain-containing protein n=1 Tax=Chlamydomonas schloesseri TaxID=2026947 RepID=A0A835WJZ3_9CHLO|nr:hypothetical protein HYH02_006526 [Chlamydomonas schloesseri]|eukprot:KAG2448639.1 hypothetical protein HYH02_006526 [Chlamydomonas schloesseri]